MKRRIMHAGYVYPLVAHSELQGMTSGVRIRDHVVMVFKTEADAKEALEEFQAIGGTMVRYEYQQVPLMVLHDRGLEDDADQKGS